MRFSEPDFLLVTMLTVLVMLWAMSMSGCTVQIFRDKPEPAAVMPAPVVINGAPTLSEEEKSTFLHERWCLSAPLSVQVANPDAIVLKDKRAQGLPEGSQKFAFGDSCDVSPGALWEAVGFVTTNDVARVLIRLWDGQPRETHTSCPNRTLFFLDFADFYKQCQVTKVQEIELQETGKKTRATSIREMWEAQEKLRVKEILKQEKAK